MNSILPNWMRSDLTRDPSVQESSPSMDDYSQGTSDTPKPIRLTKSRTLEMEESNSDLDDQSQNNGGTDTLESGIRQRTAPGNVEAIVDESDDDDDIDEGRPKKQCCAALRGWTKREKVLLFIAGFNTLLIITLFGSNMAILNQGNRSEFTAAAKVAQGGCGPGGKDNEKGNGKDNGEDNGKDSTMYSAPPSVNAIPPGYVEPVSDPSAVGVSRFADPNLNCGCASCVDSVWNNMAGQFSCGDRISYLVNEFPLLYPTQIHACRFIAFEHPCACGGCDPGRCSIPTPEFMLPNGWEPSLHLQQGYAVTPAPTPVAADTDPTVAHNDQDLYCFPEPGARATYSLWDDMVVQIKENSIPCGPGNNMFSTQTVQVDEINDTLTLQYKEGMGSEVRILLPPARRPYTYGTYRFSVQSIEVRNSFGDLMSSVLPKELVLGLFTWDDTEKYAVHENYNHEVDIEVSRWNCETNSDLQYLVQPPGFPQMHRLFTGNANSTNIEEKYQQGNQVYEFAWNPTHIDWESTAGTTGNNEFVLKTEEALYRNAADHIQCLPDIGGNMEVRINLWNSQGASQPQGLLFGDTVNVVIDNFSFLPSEQTHAANGELCSKHCQCQRGVSQCINNVCTSIA